MISDGTVPELECCMSDDRHFIIKDSVLSFIACGHSFCQSCLPVDSNLVVKCKICGVESLFATNESNLFKSVFERNVGGLFRCIEDRINFQFGKLKSIYLVFEIYIFIVLLISLDYAKDKAETIGLKAKYLEEELEMRVESIKIELDLLHEKLKNEIFVVRDDLIKLDFFKIIVANC
jgi:hypothetical protein